MQSCSPPGTPAPPQTKLDAATDLNTNFNDFFGDKEVAKETGKEAPSAAPEPPPPEPVAEVPTSAPVDAPIEIVIPEPAQREIDRIVETAYQREFVDPLKRDHEDLVRGIAQHLQPWAAGVDIERDFVQTLLRYGVDEEGFHPGYVEDRIVDMKCSNILKEKMRLYARDFFARKQRREEADQNDWKGTQRRGVEQGEIEARKEVHLLNTLVQETEFSEFARLRSLAAVGDSLAKAELDKIDAHWLPLAQNFINQGHRKAEAIRLAWRQALRERRPKSASNTPAPKKAEPEKVAPKAKKTYGSMEERFAKSLADSFEQNLSKDQRRGGGGYYK